MDVAAWLRGLGLEQYAAAFRDNDIDDAVLRRLTGEDLRELGVASVGHRRKLLDAIAALGAPAPVADASGPPAETTTLVPKSDAERRQLTVMFCDLVGSTSLASQLDPEDLREVIAAYHHAVADVVRSLDGFVAKYMGDGVLIYFGYPQAREDEAERAVMAGLNLVTAVAALNTNPGVRLACRVGIATGLVVVGDLLGTGSAQEQAVVGETPNLAARLQSLAEPDTVLVDARTHRLVGDLFEQRSLGALAIKGFAGRQRVWQMVGRSRVLSRFEALRSRATPLVGREEDVELLRRRWQQAEGGEGQVVLIAGEAGIGKSRLTAALFEELASALHMRLRYFCSPHHTDSALYPIIGQLEHAAGFEPNEPLSANLDKLDSLLSQVLTPAEDRALIAELLSLDGTDRGYPALDLTPQIRKERTFNALVWQLEALAHHRPVLMVFEDVHWIDPTSLELLDRIVERLRALPVLLLVTFRPEFAAPWIGQPHVTALTLRRLSARASATLAGYVSGNHGLAAELLVEIVGRADGVPLFLEELTKAVVEAGPGEDEDFVAAVPSASAAIPATLHASLAARLDRLGPAKEIAQIGAIIGRDFSYDLLRDLAAWTETRLTAALDQLVASELVSRRGAPPAASYVFKHALVQEAAHETLLRAERRRLHARVADLLERRAETAERQPELLAQHYAEAGVNDKAVDYWTRAGKRSVARSALAEAEAQFEKALAQLALLPDTHERAWKGLELQSSLGSVRFAVRGYAAPQTGEAYARARKLWEKLGYPAQFLRVPWGQWIYVANRADLELARHFGDNLLRLSEERGDAIGRILGHLSLGTTVAVLGEFASSRMHLEAVVNLYAPDQQQIFVEQAGINPQVMGLEFLGLILSCLGYPYQGVARCGEAVEKAQAVQHLPSLATALAVKTRILAFLGDVQRLAKCAETLFTLGEEQGYPFWREQGRIYRSLAEVRQGKVEEGLASLRTGIAGYRAAGAELWMPLFHAFEAEGEVLRGHTQVAFGLLDHALQTSRARGENWFEAELVRRRSELLQDRAPSDAEALFREALEIARRQEAKLWELRAAASLAGLWAEAGRKDAARDLLASVYSWFTEGFDTPDLKKAKALLNELA
ncbi:MAG: AAA family ATPase [Alphaproteobacteria bacterium]|nr:AAA family ATPase [Alphaproteobacteria bacterium]